MLPERLRQGKVARLGALGFFSFLLCGFKKTEACIVGRREGLRRMLNKKAS